MPDERRFYEVEAAGARRSAPAAMRNRDPIANVLVDWLPASGRVLEIASGTGEHIVHFAARFPALDWQPSDVHGDALAAIAAWSDSANLPNLRPPIILDAASEWAAACAGEIESIAAENFQGLARAGERGCNDPILGIPMHADSPDDQKVAQNSRFDVVLNLNMVHISPWSAALGLLDGAARVLKRGGALILYGPWLQTGIETAPSNLEFDRQLRERDPEWGLRCVDDFRVAACARGFRLEQRRAMPANNLMLLFRLDD